MTVAAYESANKRLWQLHKLWNIDKHRLLIPIGSANRSVILDVGGEFEQRERGLSAGDQKQLREAMRIALRPADRLYPLQDGAVIFTGPHEMFAGANFEVAFRERQIVDGEELLSTLGEFKAAAQTVVALFRPLLLAEGACGPSRFKPLRGSSTSLVPRSVAALRVNRSPRCLREVWMFWQARHPFSTGE